jgi:hypothetical protein
VDELIGMFILLPCSDLCVFLVAYSLNTDSIHHTPRIFDIDLNPCTPYLQPDMNVPLHSRTHTFTHDTPHSTQHEHEHARTKLHFPMTSAPL